MRLMSFLLLFVLAWQVFAQVAPPGVNAASQLRFGVGAYPLSMGSAFTAYAQGPLGIYWNPAALVGEYPLSFTGMYTEPFGGGVEGIGYRLQFLGAAMGIGPAGIGLGWFNSHVSDIPWTDEGGSFDYDSSVYFLSLSVGEYAEEIGAFISVGGSLKVYRDTMLEGEALGVGFDLGVLVDLGDIRFAYCSQDVGHTRYRWRGTGQEPMVYVPWIHRFGIALSMLDGVLHTTLDLSLEPTEVLPLLWRVGIELLPVEWLSIRAGIRLDPFAEDYHPVFTLGWGVSWGGIWVNYAFLVNPLPAAGISTSTHVYSLDISF